DLILKDQLFFVPLLSDLANTPEPIHLQLFAKTPISTTPATAFSANAPIGTGRAISQTLLAESGTTCVSAASARQSLAANLLSDFDTVNSICAKYNMMAALYSLPDNRLESIECGMRGMTNVTESERWSRKWHLRDVDGDCELEARIEAYLLETGFEELREWIGCVEVGLGLGFDDRRCWADVYAAAGEFLKMAYEE
ncbi:uncharacterized protein BDR25DRAFT_245180, partial [Lindgomyces ingoldianus]